MKEMLSPQAEHESREVRLELPPGVEPKDLLVSIWAPSHFSETVAPEDKKGKPSLKEIESIGGADVKAGHTYTHKKRNGEEVTVRIDLSGSAVTISGDVTKAELKNIGPFERGEADGYSVDIVIPTDFDELEDGFGQITTQKTAP